MPKKVLGQGKLVAAAAESTVKIRHGNPIRTNIPSGMAMPGPPLGTMLGQRGLNIASFCKDFNNKTSIYRQGIPLPTRIYVKPDRTYDLVIHQPTTTYFLMQAAGITRGSMPHDYPCGKVTLKHIYEIAKIKQQDPPLLLSSLEYICRLIIGSANSIGIEVVKELDAGEYQEFLDKRKTIVEQQLLEIAEEKQAKMLRKK